MTALATTLLALSTFLAGLYLGHRKATRHWREEREYLEHQYQRVIDYADDYIEANAASWRLHVVRNDAGKIVDLAIRCGTPAVFAQETWTNIDAGKPCTSS